MSSSPYVHDEDPPPTSACPDCPDFLPDSLGHLREHLREEHNLGMAMDDYDREEYLFL
jgi:hypothetical protein